MDKRNVLLEDIYVLHSQLVNEYHASANNNQSLIKFCVAFNELISSIKPKITPKRFEYIFKVDPNLSSRPELSAHLISAVDYANILIHRITNEPQLNLENEFIAVIFDYGRLLKAVVNVYGLIQGTFNGNRTMTIGAYTSYKIATQLFWSPREIQRSINLNGYTIFALRQSLELAAKEIIGLKAITKKNGEPDLYASKLPWQFIVAHHGKSYFNLPFDPLQMQIIYRWSNHFVHTGNDTYCYITALALTTVELLFKNHQVINWDKQNCWVPTNKITNVSAMRKDFEDFIGALANPKYAKWATTADLAHIVG